jgi:hypothetical protein
MLRFRIALVLAAFAFSTPTVASAGPSFFVSYGCHRGKATVTTQSGTFAVGKRGVRCENVLRKNHEDCIETDDEKMCTCANEGPALDFILCADNLIAGCEELGCTWDQDDSGDVNCTCPNND